MTITFIIYPSQEQECAAQLNSTLSNLALYNPPFVGIAFFTYTSNLFFLVLMLMEGFLSFKKGA